MSTKNDRIRLVVVGIIAVIVASGSYAKADFVWTQKAEMPVARYKHSTCVVDGKIYSIGGADPQWNALTRVDEYDPATDTWTRKADIPTAPGFASTSVVNEKIYVICGAAPAGFSSARVEVYDPVTDTWTQQTELPTKRDNVTSSAVDGIIYVIAGNDGVSRTGLVEAYDPTTDIWMQKTSMRGSKTFTSSCVVDGKIYVIGGAWTREDVEAYDPATDTWTWKADIPVTTAGLSASVVDGKIYVMGGVTATHENDNWIFTSAVYASEPIVDLNGDGIVDAADMCIIVDNWGTDNSLCDIGPTPFGDGIVDVQDLIVLAKHLCEESGLIAYWMLDETEGDIAYDSVGGYNGTLVGDPTWQTDVGMIAGALEFDGIDDYVITDFVLNPADGPFSVFAWVQGGAQGEVILSQVCPMNWDVEWLLADPVTGALATDQKLTLLHKTLTTNVVITDGEWHRVGLSWNGSERKLYVDNIEVARDSQTTLAPGGDGLQIGTGSKRTRNSYWSGLIDDVRIYDRALTAEEIAVMAQ